MNRCCGAFKVDCVINFWELARYAKMNPEELFYKLWPNDYYEDNADYGHYAIIDVLEKLTTGDDETREAWEDVRFYITDNGYRFYERAMFVF